MLFTRASPVIYILNHPRWFDLKKECTEEIFSCFIEPKLLELFTEARALYNVTEQTDQLLLSLTIRNNLLLQALEYVQRKTNLNYPCDDPHDFHGFSLPETLT